MTEYKNNSLLMGRTTGQLLAEFQASKNDSNKKERRRQNIAMGLSVLIGGADATLQNRSNNTLKKLDESKVTDIAKSSKQYDDALKLQNVQDAIDQYGGGIGGAQIHYNAIAEDAFNAQHENVKHLFEGASETQANRDMKKKWKNSFIEDNLYKTHKAKYKGIDAARIASESKEEFNKPVQDYYSDSIRLANDPSNRSIIHKSINKGAEILGMGTKRDKMFDEVRESEINLNKRNETIDKYRNVYTQKSFTIPDVYTKDTIMAEKMTENEFFKAFGDENQAEYAYQDFVKGGMTYASFEKLKVGYLAEKSMKDNNRLMEQAIQKRMLDPSYSDLSEEDQKMAKRIVSVEAMGGDASLIRSQYKVRQSISQLIDSGAKGYQQREDDPLTLNINEADRTTPEYLQAKAWAGAQLEAIRKLTGDVNWNTVRTNWVTTAQAGLYNDIRDKTTEVDSAIKNIRIPLGTGPDSELYGQIYLENQVKEQYPDKKTRDKILDQFAKSNYNLNATNGREDSSPLVDGQPAYDLMMAAQQKYFVHKESQNMVQQSFIYVEELKAEAERVGY
jgi:hypothetical protein|tara:strand:+ start:4614 stop:6296 length:1683 start_codon:yes stop_codon:yes gene_type:complete